MSEIKFGIIGGCGSSGSTLLTNLLGRSSYIISGPEFNLFNHEELYNAEFNFKKNRNLFRNKGISKHYFPTKWFLTNREFFGINNNLINTWLIKNTDSVSFVHCVVEFILNRFDHDFFIEKTPSNIYFFKNFLNVFSEVPVIHIIRDGRDVVSSLMKRGFPLFAAGSRWLYDTACGISNRGHKNYLEIKYENLITDTYGTLSLVFNHLKIEFDPSVIDPNYHRMCENISRDLEYGEHEVGKLWTNRPFDPISTSSIGRYKNDLSKNDLALLEKISLRKDIVDELNVDTISFGALLTFLEYSGKQLTDCEISQSRLNKFLIETADYFRRLRSSWKGRYFSLPRRLTYLAN